MTNFREALIGALIIAAASTFGDYAWATWIPGHRPIYGLIHGTLLFLCMGLFLGTLGRKPVVGAAAGALLGFAAAGTYYLLSPAFGYSVMFVVWIGAWIGFGLINGRLLQTRADVREVLTRGVLAAVASGAAFYTVSGIWLPFRPRGWDYAVHFASWTVAYVPGFVALLVRHFFPD